MQGAQVQSLVRELDPTCHNLKNIYIYMCIYIYIYTHTHTYIYTTKIQCSQINIKKKKKNLKGIIRGSRLKEDSDLLKNSSKPKTGL